MTGKRYFYTDPLAAAWMAKHFGMRFVSWHSGKEYDVSVIESNVGSPIESIRESQRYVVAEDSLQLLEPRLGDVVEYQQSVHRFSVVDARWFDKGFCMDQMRFADGKIIRRDGNSFMWPEVEP